MTVCAMFVHTCKYVSIHYIYTLSHVPFLPYVSIYIRIIYMYICRILYMYIHSVCISHIRYMYAHACMCMSLHMMAVSCSHGKLRILSGFCWELQVSYNHAIDQPLEIKLILNFSHLVALWAPAATHIVSPNANWSRA